MTVPFWSNDPTILLNKDYIFQLWPSSCMTFEEKLNAISRIVIVLSIFGFLLTRSVRMLVIGLVTLVVVFFLYKYRKQQIIKGLINKEGFVNVTADYSGKSRPATLSEAHDASSTPSGKKDVPLDNVLKNDYYSSTKRNPMGNVLLTEISDTPLREAAPPSFNPQVYDDITKNTKRAVQMLNPGIKNTNKQLFGDLGDKFNLDQSMIPFYSTPNTRVPNDQGAFADFLYGNMPSCRDGSAFACVQDNERYILI